MHDFTSRNLPPIRCDSCGKRRKVCVNCDLVCRECAKKYTECIKHYSR